MSSTHIWSQTFVSHHFFGLAPSISSSESGSRINLGGLAGLEYLALWISACVLGIIYGIPVYPS